MAQEKKFKPSKDKQVEQLRIPPHSTEAEQSVLGGLLLDNEAWDRVSERVVAQDFYTRGHRIIFEAIGRLKVKYLKLPSNARISRKALRICIVF